MRWRLTKRGRLTTRWERGRPRTRPGRTRHRCPDGPGPNNAPVGRGDGDGAGGGRGDNGGGAARCYPSSSRPLPANLRPRPGRTIPGATVIAKRRVGLDLACSDLDAVSIASRWHGKSRLDRYERGKVCAA